MHLATAARRVLLIALACATALLPITAAMTPARATDSAATTTSTSPTPPAKVTPTDKTDNSPALVLGGAAGALALIGLVAGFSRARLKDDD